MWKIAWVDGLNRETIADRLIVENIKNKDEALAMLRGLQEDFGSDFDWYQVISQETRLSLGMEDLV